MQGLSTVNQPAPRLTITSAVRDFGWHSGEVHCAATVAGAARTRRLPLVSRRSVRGLVRGDETARQTARVSVKPGWAPSD